MKLFIPSLWDVKKEVRQWQPWFIVYQFITLLSTLISIHRSSAHEVKIWTELCLSHVYCTTLVKTFPTTWKNLILRLRTLKPPILHKKRNFKLHPTLWCGIWNYCAFYGNCRRCGFGFLSIFWQSRS